MIVKPRIVSRELKVFRSLTKRKVLTKSEASYHSHLEKGFEGELLFDKIVENLPDYFLVLNDLVLQCNSSIFQVDSVIISPITTYAFDVKNYEGDFYIEDDKWFSISKAEIKNPLLQLKRCDTLLRQLFQELKHSPTAQTKIVFVNPHFHLYHSPMNNSIIFPLQINRFLNQLTNLQTKVVLKKQQTLVDQLLNRHLNESPFQRLPTYSFDELNKGINCNQCFSFITKTVDKTLVCLHCRKKETITSGVLRNILEFRILFPDQLITTNIIFDWCKIIDKRTIQTILSNHLTRVGQKRASYYTERE